MTEAHPMRHTDQTVVNPAIWLQDFHNRMFETYEAMHNLSTSVDKTQIQNQEQLKAYYEQMQEAYIAVVSVFRQGFKVNRLELDDVKKQLIQSSHQFSNEVWGVVARLAQTVEARNKAVELRTESSKTLHESLINLQQETQQQRVIRKTETTAM
ncbi:hypothetical protein F4804DRAFT_333802 [Jackrogersella minutella]|nr:hypothetical protein F4804DRAFT_333802 [Jackrogersella minutella]